MCVYISVGVSCIHIQMLLKIMGRVAGPVGMVMIMVEHSMSRCVRILLPLRGMDNVIINTTTEGILHML